MVDEGKGRVLGFERGYFPQNEQTGAIGNDSADAHIPPIHLFYSDINDEPTPPPHRRRERPERAKEEMQRIIG